MTLRKIRGNLRLTILLFALPCAGAAQEPAATPFEETIQPTWETQKHARTYLLDIPAPRGQITDRPGTPLAQNKLSYHLEIDFPTPLVFSDYVLENHR